MTTTMNGAAAMMTTATTISTSSLPGPEPKDLRRAIVLVTERNGAAKAANMARAIRDEQKALRRASALIALGRPDLAESFIEQALLIRTGWGDRAPPALHQPSADA